MPDSMLLPTETEITAPDGFQFDVLPEDVNLSCPLFEHHRHAVKSAEGRTITVQSNSYVRSGRAPASDHDKIKACYGNVNKADQDQVVLRQAK